MSELQKFIFAKFTILHYKKLFHYESQDQYKSLVTKRKWYEPPYRGWREKILVFLISKDDRNQLALLISNVCTKCAVSE